MPLKLIFTHAENGSAVAQMAVDGAQPIPFNYVLLVKRLFDNPDEQLLYDADDSYTPNQKNRLGELVAKINSAAQGTSISQETPSPEDSEEDTPF
mgnify:CR=1 FL=1|jgi:hypothetical protein